MQRDTYCVGRGSSECVNRHLSAGVESPLRTENRHLSAGVGGVGAVSRIV